MSSDSAFDKHIETQYLNKPYFVQLKRVWRMAKKIPNPDKPKKVGFFLQSARKLQGSAQTNEKIIHDVFGKSQQMSPKKFIEGVFSHAVPEGEKLYVKPETAYQTTQRLVPDQKLNRTIQVSVFGDIYDKILDKYKNRDDADDLFRAVNRYLSSHFANAAGFVRWTHVSPEWIHLDAFQTDFFSQLKSMAYHEKDNPEIQKIVEEFRKHEDEFFKTAVSYIVRTNPKIKMFTASTPEIVAAVENVRGDVKLQKYYHQIPKKLGFKLIPLTRLNKILRTRPGAKAEALIKKFGGALSEVSGRGRGRGDGNVDENAVKYMNHQISDAVVEKIKTKDPKSKRVFFKPITGEQVDTLLRMFPNERARSAYHQYIEQISGIVQNQIKLKQQNPKVNANNFKTEIKKFLSTKIDEIMKAINRVVEAKGNIWWSDRTMIFEHTTSKEEKRRILVEGIKQLSRY
jgi:hypothetical protein